MLKKSHPIQQRLVKITDGKGKIVLIEYFRHWKLYRGEMALLELPISAQVEA